MKKLVLLLLIAIAPALGAELRLQSDMDANADYDSTANLTFTTGTNGYCGEGTIINSDTDEAHWNLDGSTHCDSNGDGGFTECTASGEQILVGTMQFYYSCDWDGDDTCDHGSPAFSATWIGRSQGSYTPYILGYDGGSPYNEWRTYSTVDAQTLSTSVDIENGKWWRIRYSYDITNNDRKLCAKEMPSGTEYCDEDLTTSVVAFGSGGTGTWGLANGTDTDVFYGVYDEMQFYAGTYDYTFPSDGIGCAGDTASIGTEAASDRHPWGSAINVSGCTEEVEIEIYADNTTSSTLIGQTRTDVAAHLGDVGFFYTDGPHVGGGPDVDGDAATGPYARARCYNSGTPQAWTSLSQVTQATWPDAEFDGTESKMDRVEWIYYDNFNRPDYTDGLDADATPVFWTLEEVSSGSDRIELKSDQAYSTSGFSPYAYTEPMTESADATVQSKIDCTGCTAGSGGDIDFVWQMRVADEDASGINDYYQCKLEGASTNHLATKFNMYHDADADGAVDAFEIGTGCATSAAFDASPTWPKWVRCEVVTTDTNEVTLQMWVADDSSGSPGTWTLRSEAVHECIDNTDTPDGDCTDFITGAGQTVADVRNTDCTSWGVINHFDAGRVGIGVLKPDPHYFDNFAAGVLNVNFEQDWNRRSP